MSDAETPDERGGVERATDDSPTDDFTTDDFTTDDSPTDDPAAYADDGARTGGDAGRPEWDDDYLDRVAERLMYNYDLERDHRAGGERFDLYGRMVLESQKHFFHPSLNFANHESVEHLFVRLTDRVRVADLERLVDLGHELADERIDADEQHYGTDFTFVVVAADLPAAVADFVDGFRDRTLLKFGYYGHYEVNLVVVAPDEEAIVASEEADVTPAFRLWEPIEREEPGILDLIARRLQV